MLSAQIVIRDLKVVDPENASEERNSGYRKALMKASKRSRKFSRKIFDLCLRTPKSENLNP